MKSNLNLPILLQFVGVIVIIAEIILPSGGLLSLLALGIFGYSLYIVFTGISTAAGIVFVTADIILIPVLVITGLKLIARLPVTLRKELSRAEGVVSQSEELEKFMGLEGTALTDLHPSGIAEINGKRVDVVSRGEYLEKNSKIVVYSVRGNQIIVREKN
ncbi:MAG: serine protease [Deltaproteobacteria bacterium]|nr:serine protease [Deltaproteobacteria bacterium]